MRPRTQYQSFRPPVNLVDLGSQLTRSGYLLVTETDSDEIVSAIALKNPAHSPTTSSGTFCSASGLCALVFASGSRIRSIASPSP